jgi:mannan endo-1,4-beta-mannosidase
MLHRAGKRLRWVAAVPPVLLAVATSVIAPATTASATAGNALFGLFPGENNVATGLGAPSWTQMDDYLPGMVPWQGRKNDVINIYNQIHGTGGVDTVVNSYLPHIWDDLGSVPMISLNTNNYTNAQVISGSGDADIDYYANSVSHWLKVADSRGVTAPTGGRRIYIRLDWEMNAAFSPWEPAKNSTTCANLLTNEADYVSMWRHFHDRFMTTGGFDSTQVQWVYSIYQTDVFPTAYAATLSTCTNGASDVVARTYPGDSYVDWVGVDGYAYNNGTPFTSPTDTFSQGFTRLRAITSKPMSVDEVGVNTHSNGFTDQTPAAKAAWLSDYFTYIESQNVLMTLYFNIDLGAQNGFHNLAVFDKANNSVADPFGNGDTQLTGADGKLYNAYSAYKTGISNSYFTSPDPANLRMLTDAQFAGTA